MLGVVHDPDGDQDSVPAVMIDVIASIRDPVFWEWHKHLDSFGFLLQQKMKPNDPREAAPDNYWIENVSLIYKGKTDKDAVTETDILYTFMEPRDITLYMDQSLIGFNVVDDTEGRGMLVQSRTVKALNYVPFSYKLKLGAKSPDDLRPVTARIFICPQGEHLDRVKWIEMDKFVMDPKDFERDGNICTYVRDSTLASILMKASPEDEEWRYNQDDAHRANDQSPMCRCGLPRNLLLPRGTFTGMDFKMFVMLTEDHIEMKKTCCGCVDPFSAYCAGAEAFSKYPDPRPLGYPFDTPFAFGEGQSIPQLLQPDEETKNWKTLFNRNLKIVWDDKKISQLPWRKLDTEHHEKFFATTMMVGQEAHVGSMSSAVNDLPCS